MRITTFLMTLVLIVSTLNAQQSKKQTSRVLKIEQNKQQLEHPKKSVQKLSFNRTAVQNLLGSSTPQPASTAGSGWATVSLSAHNVWSDNSGYQLLLDPTATAYGTVIPPVGYDGILYPDCSVPANLYDIFTYRIPANATPACNSPFVVMDDSVTIPIPAGTYDFCIVNPVDNENIWIAGGSNSRKDNYVFEAGKKYIFQAVGIFNEETYEFSDDVILTVENDNAALPAPVSNLSAVSVGGSQIKITWTNPSQNIGGTALASLTAVSVYVNDGTTPVYTKSNPVVGGTESYTYTFSGSGTFKFTVVASAGGGTGYPQSVAITDCPLPTLPLIQNFNDYYSLGCWKMISNNFKNSAYSLFVPHMGVVSIDGQNLFMFCSIHYTDDYDETTNDYYQYLITPELPSNSPLKISFDYAKGADMNEDFIVGYSTTTRDTAAFTWMGTTTTATSTSFNDFVAVAPAGTKYIAINYRSNYCYYLFIKNLVIDVAPDNDAAITAITAPVSDPNLTATEKVTAIIRNEGANRINSLNLELTVDGKVIATEPYTGNIVPGDTASYTFTQTADLSALGDHTVSVKAILAGDQNSANDSKTVTITHIVCDVTSFPWFDNSEPNTEFAPCWQFLGGDNGEGYDGVATWKRVTWGDEKGSMFISESQIESGPFYNPVITPLNPDNWLVTPHLILNGNYTLSFDISGNGGRSILGDRYSVLVSTTGTSFSDFTEIYRDTITFDNWKTVTLPLNQYNGNAIYIAFRHWDSKGEAIKIDNIGVSQSLDNDAAITAITAPVSGHNLTANQTVTATIKNFGVHPITSLDLELTVDGNVVKTETYTGNIASWSTDTYTFTAKADLSAEGYHTVAVRAILTGDQNSDNDGISVSVKNLVCNTVNTFPWTEGFDTATSLDCWLQEYSPQTLTTIDWKLTTEEDKGSWIFSSNPPTMGTSMAYFFDEGFVRYQTKLITPTLDISALSRPGLKFYYSMPERYGNALGTIIYNDTLNIYYKTSEAGNWTLLQTFKDPVDNWKEVIIQLPNASNNYYIAFEGKNAVGFPITLDDVTVYNIPLADASVTAITAPVNGLELSAAESVTATVKNYGLNPINSIDMELTVDDKVVATETYKVNIASFDTVACTFNAKADLSAAGDHTVTVRAILSGDETTANDSKTIIVNNTVCKVETLPLIQDFSNVFSFMCWKTVSNNPENDMQDVYATDAVMGLYTNGELIDAVFAFSSSYWAENGDYNQYLISPELPPTSGDLTISFDYLSNYGMPEDFRVGYSKTTNDVAAFTWGEGITTNSPAFITYKDAAPAGTKFVAINYYSNNQSQLIIDNIVIDGKVINSIPVVNANNIIVYSSNGQIVVKVSEDSAIRVVDMTGRTLGNYRTAANSTLSISQPKGIYLLEVRSNSGRTAHKVVVK